MRRHLKSKNRSGKGTGLPTRSDSRKRRGAVLLAVLIVVVVLTLAAYNFTELMVAETKTADSYARSAQAKAFADSGVYYAAAMLSNSDTFTNTLAGNPFNNPSAFSGITVRSSDNPRLQGRFSLIGLLDPDNPNAGASSAQSFAFGVNDESGKINPNAIMKLDSSGQVLYNLLMVLPNMTDDVANSII